MPEIRRESNGHPVRGFVAPGWEDVADSFARNFARHGEVGASVCVEIAGETKIDLWGGWADKAARRPWEGDTMVVVFSCTKAATALCAHILADRGQLELAAPVSQYWPGFRAGKEAATVSMMLNHSVGVPGFRDPLPPRSVADWDYMVARLEQEPPFWEPGTRNGYHAFTFGWTVGELVRRASGQSLGAFFAEQVAGPLGLDFWIGLPETEERRVADILPAPADEPVADFARLAAEDAASVTAFTMRNTGGYFDFEDGPSGRVFAPNTRWARAAEIGAAGGITNARGLAGLYRPLAGRAESLVSHRQRQKMAAISTATERDAVLLLPTRFTPGFMARMDNRAQSEGRRYSVLIGERAFGHVGAGGSIGFADPELEMSFGYAMDQMGTGIFLNERGQSLVDAAYRCAGRRDGGDHG